MNSRANAPLILAAVVLLGGVGAFLYLTSKPDAPTAAVAPDAASTTAAPTASPTDADAEALLDAPPPPRPTPAPPPLSLLPKQERPGAQARGMIAAMRSGARTPAGAGMTRCSPASAAAATRAAYARFS